MPHVVIRLKVNKMYESYLERAQIENTEEWREWRKKIPFLTFPQGIELKVIPPFAGAIARFIARSNGKEVSVYLDCYDKLGCVGSPYWEVYPYDGDTYRCGMNETNELITAICE